MSITGGSAWSTAATCNHSPTLTGPKRSITALVPPLCLPFFFVFPFLQYRTHALPFFLFLTRSFSPTRALPSSLSQTPSSFSPTRALPFSLFQTPSSLSPTPFFPFPSPPLFLSRSSLLPCTSTFFFIPTALPERTVGVRGTSSRKTLRLTPSRASPAHSSGCGRGTGQSRLPVDKGRKSTSA